MTTFFLVRHAACDGLGQTLWGRTSGVRLNDAGRLQASALANRFRVVPLKAIYSSPLERAVETAEAIAREMNLQVIKRDRLNEVNFGDWTGRTFQSLADDPLWNRFNTQRSTARVPGGDSMIETQIRIVSELNRLSANHVDDRVAVVTHADVIKAALAQFATIHLDFIKNIEISPGSVSVVTTDEYESRLLTTNNVADFSELLH